MHNIELPLLQRAEGGSAKNSGQLKISSESHCNLLIEKLLKNHYDGLMTSSAKIN
jgi:hypothetical protein